MDEIAETSIEPFKYDNNKKELEQDKNLGL